MAAHASYVYAIKLKLLYHDILCQLIMSKINQTILSLFLFLYRNYKVNTQQVRH